MSYSFKIFSPEKPWQVTLHYSDDIGCLTMRVAMHTHGSISFSPSAVEYCGGEAERDDDGYVIRCLGEYGQVDVAREIARLSELRTTRAPKSAETLTWTPASTKPDADISVLCWRDTDEWFSGWWDDEAGAWFDAASGGIVQGVTHWAHVEGPFA